MRRRTYLASTTALLTAAVAGCSSDGDDGTTTAPPTDVPPTVAETTERIVRTTAAVETTEPAATTTRVRETPAPPVEVTDDRPVWARWLPVDMLSNPDAQVVGLDIQRARREFPESEYTAFRIPDISDAYGIPESEMAHLVGIRGGASEISAFTGTFDPAAVVESLGVPDSDVEPVRGYRVLDGQIAVGESIIVIGEDFRRFLDAGTGEVPSLATVEGGWRELLLAAGDGTLVGLRQGVENFDFPAAEEVQRTAIEIDAAGDGRARLTAHLQFASEQRASEVLDSNRSALVGDSESGGGSLRSIETEGRRIVAVVDTGSFDF